MTIAGGTRLGSYEVVARIGAGVMSVVYQVEDLKRHRHVALNWFEELKQKVPTGKR
jgi:hypothetical protein